MGLRGLCSVRFPLCAALAAGFLVFGHSAANAQSLTAAANPPAGGAGVNNSYVTGSGFPAGAISGAVAHFGPTCSAPQTASSPVTQVTVIATLRRFQFL
ncbi:MAG TPA: hypothetical protein VLV86_06450, partial [Vicinamibacterales bacterium]|nr:hypothetical protein [Vicinamibacterales bacterium]